ncbi:unnamed protein product [Lupinus luteus]|uniref:Uncharacterized protein n=1 Tax=Lupinus luteus TaxID=3873 RepID=A0AAV1YIT6_LUPLU
MTTFNEIQSKGSTFWQGDLVNNYMVSKTPINQSTSYLNTSTTHPRKSRIIQDFLLKIIQRLTKSSQPTRELNQIPSSKHDC